MTLGEARGIPFSHDGDSNVTEIQVHPFDAAVRLAPLGGDRFRGHITPAYGNMVGPFGGVIAAVMLNAVLMHARRQGDPVALTVNFAAPIKDADFVVAARAMRTNRSNQHWVLELEQEGAVAVTATALLATRRATWRSTEVLPPQAPAVDAVMPLAGEGLPAWARWVANYELRTVRGDMPCDGVEREDSASTLWVRDVPPRPLDFLSLAALSDVFFPRVMVRRQCMVPSGTVSMTVYFHADAEALKRQGAQALLGTARAQRFHDLYFDQTAQLWSQDSELLVVTHQLVYYRA